MRRPLVLPLPLAAMLLAACSGTPAVPEAEGSASAAADAGCALSAEGFDGDAGHIELAEAPPADELYAARPAVGGPHTPEWLTAGVFDEPIEERAAVHNLEHGAVAVYHDPALDGAEAEMLRGWAQERNAAGLLDERTGAGIVVAPWEDDLDPAIAFRAWGVAADCEGFDLSFADAFLLDHFGTAGVAPEGTLGSDPADVVADPEA